MSLALTPFQVDELMDRASRSLGATDYFEAERLCLRALQASREAADFERMARICLPLLEARRQKREQAWDAGPVAVLRSTGEIPRPLRPGCYLLQPPLIGRDGRVLRETADRKGVPVSVLTREPLTRAGKWPIVAVGPLVARVQVDPPWAVQRVEASPSKDDEHRTPPPEWFAAASEALGDAAIAAVRRDEHPHHRVDAFLDYLDAHPEHEKLHQALAGACRAAVGTDEPLLPRRRGIDSPFSF